MGRFTMALLLCAALTPVPAPGSAQTETDVTGVIALLDVLDAVMAKHADYEDEVTRLGAMNETERRRVLDVVGRIDLGACRARTAEWLPEDEYRVPPVHFVYDGNGDAFAPAGLLVKTLE